MFDLWQVCVSLYHTSLIYCSLAMGEGGEGGICIASETAI